MGGRGQSAFRTTGLVLRFGSGLRLGLRLSAGTLAAVATTATATISTTGTAAIASPTAGPVAGGGLLKLWDTVGKRAPAAIAVLERAILAANAVAVLQPGVAVI